MFLFLLPLPNYKCEDYSLKFDGTDYFLEPVHSANVMALSAKYQTLLFHFKREKFQGLSRIRTTTIYSSIYCDHASQPGFVDTLDPLKIVNK
jgi:hypothetical protein